MGAILRKLMLMVNQYNVDKIQVDDLDQMQYNAIPNGDLYRVGIVVELINVKAGLMAIPTSHICTS